MDVVYVVERGDDNQELRHSLRSIERNLAFGKVWMAGYTPNWVTGVRSVDVDQDPNVKWAFNLWAALQEPDLSDPFILFNDDFYVLDYMPEIPMLHRGSAKEVLQQCLALYDKPGPHTAGLRSALYFLDAHGVHDPLSYELHVPMVMHKEPVLKTIEMLRHDPNMLLHTRSVYGNLYNVGGEFSYDVKVLSKERARLDIVLARQSPFLSSADTSFRLGAVGGYVRRRFPLPSRFEKEAP